MNLFDIFESEEDMFAESPKAKILAILHNAKEDRQRHLDRMLKAGDYPEAQIVAKEQSLEGIDLIAKALKFGGVEPAAKEWHRIFYAKAYSGEPGAAELSDEGLDLAYTIKDDTGVDFFRLSNVLDESDDEMFATKKKADLTKVTTATLIELLKVIIDDQREAYSSVHKGQATRIKMELKRRGVLLPYGIEDIDESEDEMFAPGKFQKWIKALKEVLNDLYAEEEANLQVNQEPKHIRATEQLMSDYDFLRSELERDGMQAFMNGLDMVEQYAINSIDADLARKGINLSDIEKAFFPEKFNESEDDMFSDNRVTVNPRVLSKLTKTLADKLEEYVNTIPGQSDTAETYLDDANALRRASNAFLSGLRAGFKELESIEDISTWEYLEDLANRHNINLSDLSDRYDAGQLTEEDEMFSNKPSTMWQIIGVLDAYADDAEQSSRVCDDEDDAYCYSEKADLAREVIDTFKTQGFLEGLKHFKQFSNRYGHEPAEELADETGITLDSLGFDLNEEDDMFANRSDNVPDYFKKYVGKPVIGTARVVNDLDSFWDWRDEWQVDEVEELPVIWQKFYHSQGRTVPVVDLNDNATFAVINVGIGMPIRITTRLLRDIRVDHPTAVDESEEDMFAPAFKRVDNFHDWFAQCGGVPWAQIVIDHYAPDSKRLKELNISLMGYFDTNSDRVKGVYYVYTEPGEEDKSFGTITGRSIRGFTDYLNSDPAYLKLTRQLSEEDDMFADLNVAKKLGRIMWREGYHLGSLSMSNIRKELNAHPELKAQLIKDYGVAEVTDGMLWDVFDSVVFEFEETLQRQRNMNESDDEMFAPSWKQTVIQMLRKLLESAVLQNRFEIEEHDLEYIQRLIAAFQTGNIDNAKKVWRNFDLDELDDALYLYVVRSHPNIDLYKLLDDEEDFLDEDDMFAERWYSDDQVKNLIRKCFTNTGIGSGIAREWMDMIAYPSKYSKQEILDMNNEYAEKNDIPFRFIDWKWNDEQDELLWTLSGAVPRLNESDDMFASAFRVERDVMEWQQKAMYAARDFLGFSTKGLNSFKDDANNIVYMYQLQDNGDCTGVYYSPQPATIETNIGTYNPKFKGGFKEYLKQDPHNPNKHLAEEDDDMFATGTMRKMPEIIQDFAYQAEKMIERPDEVVGGDLGWASESDEEFDQWVEECQNAGAMLQDVVEALKKSGLIAGFQLLRQMSNSDNSIASETAHLALSDMDDIYGINPNDYLSEDEMFSASPNVTTRLGNAIEAYGETYMDMADSLLQNAKAEGDIIYGTDLAERGKAMIRAGKAFQKGMQSGMFEWVVIQPDDRNSFYRYSKEVENWNPEDIIGSFLSESVSD